MTFRLMWTLASLALTDADQGEQGESRGQRLESLH